MSTFTVNHNVLENLLKLNHFELPEAEMVFFGFRGAVLSDAGNQDFQKEIRLSLMDINYVNPRCTLLQWKRTKKQIAGFPASTMPHQKYIIKSVRQSGNGANSLMTGMYVDYRKGVHQADKPSGHDAFRQTAMHPIRRTVDDLDYDADDRIEYLNPFDNIHCGWFDSLSAQDYASAGCQVVMGFPKCKKPGRTQNSGPWRLFLENAYATRQRSYPYVLLNGIEVFNFINANQKGYSKLRFGSSGPLVKTLQKALKAGNFYEGDIDGDFGPRTMKALEKFQRSRFGNPAVDCIAGRITAEELGVKFPVVG